MNLDKKLYYMNTYLYSLHLLAYVDMHMCSHSHHLELIEQSFKHGG